MPEEKKYSTINDTVTTMSFVSGPFPPFIKALEEYYRAVKELENFGVGYKTTCDIGEQFCSRLFGITIITTKNNPDIDGIDQHGKRVQIKTRRRHKSKSSPTKFAPFNIKRIRNIDYAYLVILGEDFLPEEIWAVERVALKTNINKKTKSFHLTQKAKKSKGVSKVFPTLENNLGKYLSMAATTLPPSDF